MLMAPNDRPAANIEGMNLASPNHMNNTDRSNPNDPNHNYRSASQPEHKPGGIQHLMHTYQKQKPSLQKKIMDLTASNTPGQPRPATQSHQDQGSQDEQTMQLTVTEAEQSPIKKTTTEMSYVDERNDEALQEVMQ